ncbi:hypothetical protein AX13_04900 [Comamonas aquatica DA1877]|uniref:Uncharacterized protein n=1 Tax=Comamonas aquatica DA1877 TaxID=1457173 RepID=A0A014NZX5_9BURK|nr:hypothetical protein AX13_04900 [Comamonas aquatica DA1877]
MYAFGLFKLDFCLSGSAQLVFCCDFQELIRRLLC